MFQFFNIPRANYRYYKPTIYLQRYDPIESYLLNAIKRAEEYEKLKSLYYQSLVQQQRKQDEKAKCHENQPINNDTPKVDSKSVSKPKQFYYLESHSHFDGEKIVEERKEQKVDSDGNIHNSLKRRLGDRWYETEQIKDKEGKTTVKESWHNVSEEDIDNFKEEWLTKSGCSLQLKEEADDKSAVTNETENEIVDNKEIENESINIEYQKDQNENIDNNKQKCRN